MADLEDLNRFSENLRGELQQIDNCFAPADRPALREFIRHKDATCEDSTLLNYIKKLAPDG